MKRKLFITLFALGVIQAQAQWNLNGNNAPAGSFLGTTNNVDLEFRRNNILAGRLDDYANVSLGLGALSLITNGRYNIAIGLESLHYNTTGSYNTANGTYTLYRNTIGDYNTANGNHALSSNTTGSYNTANGLSALFFNTSGTANTATGAIALLENMYGSYNTANGSEALRLNMAGSYNTANGYQALYDNTSGNHNTALGANTGQGITTGSGNTILGANVQDLPKDLNNTIILASGDGSQKLYINEAGSTGIGTTSPKSKLDVTGSLRFNGELRLNNAPGIAGQVLTSAGPGTIPTWTTPAVNPAGWRLTGNIGTNPANNFIGTADNQDVVFKRNNVRAGLLHTSNTAYGISALSANTTGSGNTAQGSNALSNNTTGNNNAAVGNAALNSNTSGLSNTAIGSFSLQKNTTGKRNTAVGNFTLNTNTTGSGNTAIGYNAHPNAGNLKNTTSIGYNASATSDNQLMLGSSTTNVRTAAGTVATTSDGRFKRNVQKNVPGLEFIKQLNPVTYTYDLHAMDKFIKGSNAPKDEAAAEVQQYVEEAMLKKERKIYSGFIAQEVEQAAEKAGYDFSGVHKPENSQDPYALAYSEFVVPLVKAAQQLSNENDSLKTELAIQKKQISDQQKQIDLILQKLNKPGNTFGDTKSVIALTPGQGIHVYPNPNPGSFTLYAGYDLQKANIQLFDLSGKAVAIQLQPIDAFSKAITLSKVIPGSYVLKVTTPEKMETSKIIVQ